MSPLLEQFLGEARDLLQSIAEKLMRLEGDPSSADLMNELFRLVHTLKGSSGLFDFPEMTRVLHAGEDLMDAVRDSKVAYSRALADQLLNAMDFVSMLLDEIEEQGTIGTGHSGTAKELTEALRLLLNNSEDNTKGIAESEADSSQQSNGSPEESNLILKLPSSSLLLSQDEQMKIYQEVLGGAPLSYIEYTPEDECFFKGEDPLFIARQVPCRHAFNVKIKGELPALDVIDPYRCQLVFEILTSDGLAHLEELFRYVPEQVNILTIDPTALIVPQGTPSDTEVYNDFIEEASRLFDAQDYQSLTNVAQNVLELSGPDLLFSSKLRWLLHILAVAPEKTDILRALIEYLPSADIPDWSKVCATQQTVKQTAERTQSATYSETELEETVDKPLAPINTDVSEDRILSAKMIWDAQINILEMPDTDDWVLGRLKSVGAVLNGLLKSIKSDDLLAQMNTVLKVSLEAKAGTALLNWLKETQGPVPNIDLANIDAVEYSAVSKQDQVSASTQLADTETGRKYGRRAEDKGVKFGRRAEDAYTGPKTLKVEQTKIDRLMNLIGEMVVSKNSLPYLASRAENQFGVRELARDIKNQYSVINRISEEMQDAIMEIRMMPVSFVFQRFPRLVRDISRKIGKEVNLVLEGEDTEADKNIIEALADPLMHIVRNSLDHGLETIEARKAEGKPTVGTLKIRASQESDSVLIEISDDGKGINPEIIKRKAYEKGIIDETTLERISEQDAINLIFAAGFSTAEAVSDLSGRGVGMDVVRTAIEQVNGSIKLASEVGKGTTIQLSLPLSMAVKTVMIVESNKQAFGISMDMVVETVRVPKADIRNIKNRQAAVLRNRIVPLCSLNELLALSAPQKPNDEEEYATLVIRYQGEQLGIIVDDFRETVDIILKPMSSILNGLTGYAGSALLGDGTVLMVLNPRDLI